MINKKKICVVGCGYWGKNHVKTLAKLGALGGVVEKNQDSVNNIKKLHPQVFCFNDLNDSFKANFDGYIVATPVETHFKIAKCIIKKRFDLLIEKPLVFNMKEALEIKNLANQFNVKILVGHVLLFHPAFQKIKKIIDSGKLGKIQYLYSNRLNLGKIRTEENVFWSFAPHDIALFQYLIGGFPDNITSRGSDIFNRGIHDTTITSFEYQNDIMAHLFVSWLHPFKEHRFIVIGENGMISFEDSSSSKPLIFYDKTVKWNQSIPQTITGSNHLIEYNDELPLDLELKYFINNLDKKRFDISNCDLGIEVIKILEQATNSLKNR